jgi:DNA invertase Pin-like site-specific DNA recombinase
MSTVSIVKPLHLNRTAIVYIRQSTIAQVRFHKESTERQYALREKALNLGWSENLVQVIDEDLGISGAHKFNRQGFQRLVGQVSLGEVGAIFGLEISRLARSSADLLQLLEICALYETIVIDEDGFYDLNDFNDRLILGFKGTMSEAELHFLRARLIGGKKNKAHKGELHFPLPVGYCFDSDGSTSFDPDEAVQTAVRHVFSSFQASGSAYGVVKFFATNGLQFPKRAYGGVWAGKLIWGTLTHSRVLGILYNPAYTGAYCFGRYKYRKRLDNQGGFKTHTVRLPIDQWEVLIHDHHQGYITWSQYEENLLQLQQNRTNVEVSGAAREGNTLLQGLLICGKCGRHMSVRYTGNGGIQPRYECKQRWELGKSCTCSSIRAEPLDQAVAKRIMEILQPAELELALLSLDKLIGEDHTANKSWQLALEQSQFEVDRAYRQYDLSEPENRIVVRTLEAKWNEKLLALGQLKEEYEQYKTKRAWSPTDEDRRMILRLAEDIPRIWNAPTTIMKDRKRIVRLLIEDVTVTCQPLDPDVQLGIRWRSRHNETIQTKKSLPPSITRKHVPDTIERVKELSKTMSSAEIADHFNKNGYRTPEGRTFTESSIAWLRYRYKIPAFVKHNDELTVKDVANRFNISTTVVYYWLQTGKLQGSKKGPGCPWRITIDAATENDLRSYVETSNKISKAKCKKSLDQA